MDCFVATLLAMTWYYDESHCERSEVATQRAPKAFAFAKNEQLRKWTAKHPCILVFFRIMQRSHLRPLYNEFHKGLNLPLFMPSLILLTVCKSFQNIFLRTPINYIYFEVL